MCKETPPGKKMDWNDWLNQPLRWDVNKELERYKVIYRFVKDGLTPFFNSRGYIFKRDLQTICSRIATGLFNNEGKHYLDSDWAFGEENTDYIPEEKEHYHFIFSSDDWDDFWRIWGKWDDVANDFYRGLDRRMDIEEYCWTQLDLDKSEQTKKILDMLGIDEDVLNDYPKSGKGNKDHQSRTDDIYLKEAMESGQYGGYRK